MNTATRHKENKGMNSNHDPNAEDRRAAREFTSMTVAYYRCIRSEDHRTARQYARVARECSGYLISRVGAEFGEALLTYCREEAMLLAAHPDYTDTHGHWVLANAALYGWGGVDRTKLAGVAR